MAASLKTFIGLYEQVKTEWENCEGKHWWIVPLNLALESVCRKNPSHADAAQVYAKVRLINRAYAANLEKNKKVKWAEMEVAKVFARAADPVMQPLCSLRRLDRGTLDQVVRCHTELMSLAKEATETWTVSFCSKYLSFHFPHVAPIFDSSAVKWAKALLPFPDESGWDSRVLDYDYGYHCLRVLQLLERLQEAGVKQPNLRVVDFVLYSALEDKE